MTFTRRAIIKMAMAAAASGLLVHTPIQANTWPDKPVTLMVPYSPGGGTDIIARLVGSKLSELWGQSVVVEKQVPGRRKGEVGESRAGGRYRSAVSRPNS